MKITVIGDIHGRSVFSYLPKLKKKDSQMLIFLGDYCDSFDISNNDILFNLKKIIELKKKFPEKVILLLGNHDLQYFEPDFGKMSGYRSDMNISLKYLFEENRKFFNLFFMYKKYLFSHAGISFNWLKMNIKTINRHKEKNENLVSVLEKMYKSASGRNSLFQVGRIRGGFSKFGGPFWADKRELETAPLKGIIQVVGHSSVSEITHSGTSVFCDCLHNTNEFYNLDI